MEFVFIEARYPGSSVLMRAIAFQLGSLLACLLLGCIEAIAMSKSFGCREDRQSAGEHGTERVRLQPPSIWQPTNAPAAAPIGMPIHRLSPLVTAAPAPAPTRPPSTLPSMQLFVSAFRRCF
jgi:hypothetical protein